MEEWKVDTFYNSGYLVSSMGKVKNPRRGTIRKLPKDKDGYLRFTFIQNKKAINAPVHRLVAGLFVDGFAPGLEVNHIDGIRENNTRENLEWSTHTQNMEHAKFILNTTTNEKAVQSRRRPVIQLSLTNESIKGYTSVAEASRDTGIAPSSICDCCKQKRKEVKGFKWRYAI